MKNFITLLHKIKNRIDTADYEFRFNYNQNDYKCNPFIANPLKTYVWVEKLKHKTK